MSPSAFARAKESDPQIAAALQRGRDELELDLIRRVLEPELPEGKKLSPTERVALMKARQFGAIAIGNSYFAWRSDAALDAGKSLVTIEFKLPAALDESQYRAVIDGQALERKDA